MKCWLALICTLTLHVLAMEASNVESILKDLGTKYVPGSTHNDLIADHLDADTYSTTHYAYQAIREICKSGKVDWVTSLAGSRVVPELLKELEQFSAIRRDSFGNSVMDFLGRMVSITGSASGIIQHQGALNFVQQIDRILEKVPMMSRWQGHYYQRAYTLLRALLACKERDQFVPAILQTNLAHHAMLSMKEWEKDVKMVAVSRSAVAFLSKLACSHAVVLPYLSGMDVLTYVSNQLTDQTSQLFMESLRFVHDLHQAYKYPEVGKYGLDVHCIHYIYHPNHEVSRMSAKICQTALYNTPGPARKTKGLALLLKSLQAILYMDAYPAMLTQASAMQTRDFLKELVRGIIRTDSSIIYEARDNEYAQKIFKDAKHILPAI